MRLALMAGKCFRSAQVIVRMLYEYENLSKS